MTNATIDNSIESDLNKVILWQYDTATNLCAIIGTTEFADQQVRGLLPEFFYTSTEKLWDDVAKKLNIANPLQADDWGLSVWGRLVGAYRPNITVGETTQKMSTNLYRKVIVARLRLMMSNASPAAYSQFCSYVFGENVGVTDNLNMSISFAWTGPTEDLTAEQAEQKAALEQVPDAIFIYPSGVKSAVESDGPVLGFYEQVRDANGNALVTNAVINNQSTATASYTYTKNGYTYTKTHKDFKIANLDHGTIAWNRFAR